MKEIIQLIQPLIVIGITFITGFILRKILYNYLHRITRKTKSKIDDIVIEATKSSYFLWVLLGGLYLALKFSALSASLISSFHNIIAIIVIISLTIVISNIAKQSIQLYADRLTSALPITSLTKNLSTSIIFIIGLLFILNIMGISITPILTALGVGGLAVALALQDTLSNLFVGLYVILSKQIRLGDYIKLESGEEGCVADITWRCTKICLLSNNIIIIPNIKLAQSIITNYNLPDKIMALLIPINVSYHSDPDHVEKVLIEEAVKAQKELSGMNKEIPPSLRFTGFGEFSLNFTLVCQVNEFKDQHTIQHELRKRILKRFKKEGIEIPFPTKIVINQGSK